MEIWAGKGTAIRRNQEMGIVEIRGNLRNLPELDGPLRQGTGFVIEYLLVKVIKMLPRIKIGIHSSSLQFTDICHGLYTYCQLPPDPPPLQHPQCNGGCDLAELLCRHCLRQTAQLPAEQAHRSNPPRPAPFSSPFPDAQWRGIVGLEPPFDFHEYACVECRNRAYAGVRDFPSRDVPPCCF